MDKELENLELQLQNGNPSFEEFKEYFDRLKSNYKSFQSLLHYAMDMKKDQKKFEQLYKTIAGLNASDLVDKLTKKGYAYKKDLGKSFEGRGYRLLEQTRAGKRDEVYYGILRIFVTQNKKFPNDLIEAFKPIYSDEMFKVFIFSFLSGIIGKEQQTENKN